MLAGVRPVRSLVVAVILGCGAPQEPAASPTAPAADPGWRTPAADANHTLEIPIAPEADAPAVAAAIVQAARSSGAPCGSYVLVWGDARVDERARAARVAVRGGEALEGWLLCESDLEGFLAIQRTNPRIAGRVAHVAELVWQSGQLSLRRTWTPALAPLGDLSSPPEGVLQKGELLAAAFEPSSAGEPARAERLIAVLRRVPKYFLFSMWAVR
jgi:hypothetical protein